MLNMLGAQNISTPNVPSRPALAGKSFVLLAIIATACSLTYFLGVLKERATCKKAAALYPQNPQSTNERKDDQPNKVFSGFQKILSEGCRDDNFIPLEKLPLKAEKWFSEAVGGKLKCNENEDTFFVETLLQNCQECGLEGGDGITIRIYDRYSKDGIERRTRSCEFPLGDGSSQLGLPGKIIGRVGNFPFSTELIFHNLGYRQPGGPYYCRVIFFAEKTLLQMAKDDFGYFYISAETSALPEDDPRIVEFLDKKLVKDTFYPEKYSLNFDTASEELLDYLINNWLIDADKFNTPEKESVSRILKVLNAIDTALTESST